MKLLKKTRWMEAESYQVRVQVAEEWKSIFHLFSNCSQCFDFEEWLVRICGISSIFVSDKNCLENDFWDVR